MTQKENFLSDSLFNSSLKLNYIEIYLSCQKITWSTGKKKEEGEIITCKLSN
jgi:hypothetical protein